MFIDFLVNRAYVLSIKYFTDLTLKKEKKEKRNTVPLYLQLCPRNLLAKCKTPAWLFAVLAKLFY